jgi:pyridoxamine 5'-phosphate oxidase
MIKKRVAAVKFIQNEVPLLERELFPNPVEQFKCWFEQAKATALSEPSAMTLATSSSKGKPSARMVLLKSYNDEGFVFFTNYASRKGRELTQNPYAALVFWWEILERQVRIEGKVEKIPLKESKIYFANRPRGSQLAAWSSKQSEVIHSREILEQNWRELDEKYREKVILKPPDWGGFKLKPATFEFWQGRTHRLHDRLRYSLQADLTWKIERLSP